MTRILVVEDEHDISWVLARALQEDGYEVATADDGVLALEEARRQPPGLVLMDLGFPRMDAVTFVQRYRQLPGCADSPIIAMSATHCGPPRSLEAQAFFEKPFDLDLLLATVRQLAASQTR
jgi:DNA-binding response OmpR family regulator